MQSFFPPPVDDDMVSVACEYGRNGFPEAGSGSGDECYFTQNRVLLSAAKLVFHPNILSRILHRMGRLIVVPTPIGNLEDITLRAIRLLREADLILAEDTRVTKTLLNHYQVSTPLRAYHMHNEHKVASSIAEELEGEKTFALVSDAGTPGISDPAYLLVKACLEKGVEVDCLPGPTAFVPALVKSGLPASSFIFEGFLPQKKGRQKRLLALKEEERTMIFYESPFRLMKALEELKETFGSERKASVSRELTKIFEETINGTLIEIISYYKTHTLKGEFVIVVHGKE
jgi:16S rRNA (cytidine1402-2'-O)-methyltransferase